MANDRNLDPIGAEKEGEALGKFVASYAITEKEIDQQIDFYSRHLDLPVRTHKVFAQAAVTSFRDKRQITVYPERISAELDENYEVAKWIADAGTALGRRYRRPEDLRMNMGYWIDVHGLYGRDAVAFAKIAWRAFEDKLPATNADGDRW